MADEKRLERIEDKLDKVAEKQQEQHITLVRLTDQVEIHVEGIKQTRLLIAKNEETVEAKIAPVLAHVQKIESWITITKALTGLAGKVIGGMILLAGGIEGVVALLEYLSKK